MLASPNLLSQTLHAETLYDIIIVSFEFEAHMPNAIVRNIPEDQYTLLRQEARQRGSSVNSEILDAIRCKVEDLKRRKRAARAMTRIDKLRAEIARKYPHQPDSVDLIREDRDNR